ncbi:uncharacterized protein [Rutidosis leptorrhynchoides]|uniref:uncharacterized protein n=1 Tax=Rutidosis leptorrhynchoides TaxID=125765 RepID=UPI003A99DA8C
MTSVQKGISQKILSNIVASVKSLQDSGDIPEETLQLKFKNSRNDGNCHVLDARKSLDDSHLPTSSYRTRWTKVIPLKINIFIWRLIMDRLPSRINFALKGFDINTNICLICSVGGDLRDHTFIFCRVANTIWRRIRIWTAIPWPDSFIITEDAFDWMDSSNDPLSKKTHIYSIVAATLWWLLRFRNDMLHENGTIKERDLFVNIRLSSFAWLQARSKFAPTWTTWLCNPL